MDDEEFVRIGSLIAYPLAHEPLSLSASPPPAAADTPQDARSSAPSAAAADHAHVPLANATTTHSERQQTQLSVSEETFAVIKRQTEHRRLRAALRLHRQDKVLKKYLARWGDLSDSASAATVTTATGSSAKTSNKKQQQQQQQPRTTRETLAEIATSVDFSPCMLARVLLEAKFGWSKTAISNVFKDALAVGVVERAEPTAASAGGNDTANASGNDSHSSSSSTAANSTSTTHWRGLDARAHAQLLREVRGTVLLLLLLCERPEDHTRSYTLRHALPPSPSPSHTHLLAI